MNSKFEHSNQPLFNDHSEISELNMSKVFEDNLNIMTCFIDENDNSDEHNKFNFVGITDFKSTEVETPLNELQFNIHEDIKQQIKNSTTPKESSYSIAMKFKSNHTFKIFEDILYVWDENCNYYTPLTNLNADIFIRKNAPPSIKPMINSRTIREIVSWLRSKCEEILNEHDLYNKRNYVAFKNGVLNLKSLKLIKHTPALYFTSVINAEYDSEIRYRAHNFDKFINSICHGDNKLKHKFQELFGYVLSEIRDIKIIPYLIGPKDSGKSIVLKLLEYMIGHDFCSSLSFFELNQQEYLNMLLGKKLNTCGETAELKLNRLDILKKLSGGDRIMSRALYDKPVALINKAALIFAGNHLPVIDKIDTSGAFSDRLLIFPFENAIPKEQQDPLLFKKLISEINYIAEWSIQGLLRLIENDYVFTSTERDLHYSESYTIQSNSLKYFFDNLCMLDVNAKTYSYQLDQAYENFCDQHSIIPATKLEFHRYLKSRYDVKYKKFRLNDENKNGYFGIKLVTSNFNEWVKEMETVLDSKIEKLLFEINYLTKLFNYNEWLSISDAAKYAGVSYNTFIKFRHRGLKVCEIDGIKRVSKKEIDRFLEENSF